MVSSINSSDSNGLQQLMAQMYQKMNSADTDGTKGLSKSELSSVDAGSDVGGAAFLKSLNDQFDSIDADGNGQLSASEISSAKPPQSGIGGMGAMGPPPGLEIEGSVEETSTKASTDATSSTSSTSSTDSTSSDSIETLLEKLMAKILEEISNVQKKAESGNSEETKSPKDPISSLTASADTDGTSGLSLKELSSVDSSSDAGKANFINNLIKNFESIDSNSDGQLSTSEISASKPDGQTMAVNNASNGLNDLGSSLGSLSSSFVQKLLSSYQNGGLSALASSLNIAG